MSGACGQRSESGELAAPSTCCIITGSRDALHSCKAFLASSPAQMRAANRRLQNEGSKRSLVGRTVVEPNPHSSEVSPEAKEAFREDLIARWAAGRIGFVDLGTIAWLATRAGAKGVEDLCVKPGSTNAAKTLRLSLGLPPMDDILFPARVPLWDAHLEERVIKTMHIKLPHEALARHYEANSCLLYTSDAADE